MTAVALQYISLQRMANRRNNRPSTKAGSQRTRSEIGFSRNRAATRSSAKKRADSGSPVNPVRLKELYSAALKCRIIEEKALSFLEQGMPHGPYEIEPGRE